VDLGNAEGIYQYGVCLHEGQGIEQDIALGARYLKASADLGDSDGMCDYGTCLARGSGVEQDVVSAVRYYKMSADLGNSKGFYLYAGCFKDGRGVDRDLISGARYPVMSVLECNSLAETFMRRRSPVEFPEELMVCGRDEKRVCEGIAPFWH
jgi:TPR repeat protein